MIRRFGAWFSTFILVGFSAHAQAAFGLTPTAAQAQTPAPTSATTPQPASISRRLHATLTINDNKPWTDTTIDLVAGDKLVLSASAMQSGPSSSGSESQTIGAVECVPDGLARGWKDLLRILPVNSAGRGALIARVGEDPAVPFLAGAKLEQSIEQGGRLYLGTNEVESQPMGCSYIVKLDIEPGSQAVPPPRLKVSTDFLPQLPARVQDAKGNQGDMVNFLLLGSEQKMEAVFSAAGWVSVDRTKKEAALHMILSTLNKDAYTALPMSELYLFNRPQDYGFARAEPLEVVETRHHLRLWKAPFQIDGQEVWVGAATHDTGFARDNRTNGVTHKIDPDIDKERAYVGASLGSTGALAGTTFVSPPDPVRQAKTATGEDFHSDGRILVMAIK